MTVNASGPDPGPGPCVHSHGHSGRTVRPRRMCSACLCQCGLFRGCRQRTAALQRKVFRSTEVTNVSYGTGISRGPGPAGLTEDFATDRLRPIVVPLQRNAQIHHLFLH